MDKWDDTKRVEAEWSQIETNERQRESKEDKVIVLRKEHQRFYDKLRKKIEKFLQGQSGNRMDAAAKYILLAPDFFVLLARLMQDKRVPLKSKALAGLAVAYFISPVDFLPEIIAGPLGFLDDIILSAYAISRIVNEVDKSILLEHWNGEENLLEIIQELLHKAEELVDSKVLGKIKKLLQR